MHRSLTLRVLATAVAWSAVFSASVLAAPAASAATCSDVEVVFARGSLEPSGLGTVGAPLVSAVRSALPGRSVTSYAVRYAAAFSQTSTGAGATDMSAHIVARAATCPATRFVVGGYSQGASVTDVAIGATPLWPGTAIPASLAPRVVAVVAFGNPLGLVRRTISHVSPTYADRAIEFCNTADPVCGATGTGPGFGHLTYGFDSSTTRAAAFVASRL